MHAHHLSIGLVGQSSLAGNVNDHYALFALEDISESLNLVAVDVCGRLVKERLALSLCENILAVLEYSLRY